MKKLILSILFLSVFCLAVHQVFAQCACKAQYKNITAHNELKLADAVFVGTITEIKKSARDKSYSYVETVKFQVKNAWKQDLETFVTVRNTIQGCLNGFEAEEEWLIYAYDNGDGTFRTHCCCSRTKLFSKVVEDLKEFEEKGEKQTTVKPEPS